MIRIAICDDSSVFLHHTKSVFDAWNQTHYKLAVSTFEDGDTLIKSHREEPFDIILLDVVMPCLNGMETAKELRKKDPAVRIVFLTSSAEYAVDSYAVKASNYLLKPILPKTLLNCISELIGEIHTASPSILIRSLHDTHRILLRDIELLEAQGKQVQLILTDGKSIITREPLYSLEEKLSLSNGFYKCHRSFIINLHHVTSYTLKEIQLRSGTTVPLSRSVQKQFDSIYFSFVFGEEGGLQ